MSRGTQFGTHILVVMKTSSRGTPDCAMPRPTSASFAYACAVSMCRKPECSAAGMMSDNASPRMPYVPKPSEGIRAPCAATNCISGLCRMHSQTAWVDFHVLFAGYRHLSTDFGDREVATWTLTICSHPLDP